MIDYAKVREELDEIGKRLDEIAERADALRRNPKPLPNKRLTTEVKGGNKAYKS